MIQAIKAKALIYICLVHLGLVVMMAALFHDYDALNRTTFSLLAVGAGLMYGSFLFAALSIWIPVQPWVARYQRTKAWREWILDELPTILALIPVAFLAVKLFKTAWGEIKTHKEKGDLDVSTLAGVAQKFATEAETLSKDPVVEMARKRLRGQE
jgi:hypothetical protein